MIVIVQLVLVVAVVLVSLALMRGGSNARHLAIRRLLLMVFALAAAVSIFIPEILTRIAQFFGIGRGTDLVLYALILCFFVFTSTTYQRFRQSETALTRLARRIALDEAPRPWLDDESPRLAPPAAGDPSATAPRP
ncbi:DUF2304 domain-containing protein [Sinomonas sp. ASV486]|uniref:DUF2304 domain-containing protein n=1 Tax=Sinomonas sp. ASV486 TaxID=3051170 RepID=UPI0027DCFC40|nr:DUF2304 domain-containing protein [Sinomonas sp. ASV486]MDQ4490976.1 DUF2304 domain-containing protein [Sinomonas sp. ASV486]